MKSEKQSFSDSIFGTILSFIIAIVVGSVAYLGWVNSGSNDGNFFGLTFQYPFESKDHYCWRKSEIIFVVDTSAYQACMRED